MPRTFVWHPSRGPARTASFKFKDGDRVRIKQIRSGIGHEALEQPEIRDRVIEVWGERGVLTGLEVVGADLRGILVEISAVAYKPVAR